MSTPQASAPKRLPIDIGQALAIGVLCFLLALILPVVIYSVVPAPDLGPQAASPTGPRPQVLTPLDMVRVTTFTPLVETVPFFLAACLIFGTPIFPKSIRTPLYLALSFAYGYFAHGGGLWNVGRGAAFLLLGWQFTRYVDQSRVAAAFWLTALAHSAYNAMVVAVWAVRNL